jgi:hypothetical protein
VAIPASLEASHDHSVIADGVFADDADGQLAFFELPPPIDADVASIARGIADASRTGSDVHAGRSSAGAERLEYRVRGDRGANGQSIEERVDTREVRSIDGTEQIASAAGAEFIEHPPEELGCRDLRQERGTT